MLNGYLKASLILGATIALIGCGGGSGGGDTTTTVTGEFVDNYVGGLDYNCSSGRTGVTNSGGEYTCNIGDTVSFYVGGYLLGSASASSGILTPDSLYPDNPEAALNVAQLLQTIDSNSTDDIITIPEDFALLDDVNTTPTDADFDLVIEGTLETTLVTEEEAQLHLDESALYALLSGNTFYAVDDNDSTAEVVTLTFNTDVTAVTFTDSQGSGTDTAYVDGDRLYVGAEGEYHSIIEIMEDYVLIYDYFPLEPESQTRLYYAKADAQAYLDSLRVDPAAVVGSWYMGDASQTDNIVTLTLFANGYYVFLQDGVADPYGQDGIERGTYSIDSATGALSVTTLVDTNGEWGLSHMGSTTVAVNGDTMTVTVANEGSFAFTKVPSDSTSYIGSWYAGDASQTDNIFNIILFDNGYYVLLQDEGADPYGEDGMERGSYSVDASTGALTTTTLVDTNGEWGLSHIGSATVTVNGDTMDLTVTNEGTFTLNRVP